MIIATMHSWGFVNVAATAQDVCTRLLPLRIGQAVAIAILH